MELRTAIICLTIAISVVTAVNAFAGDRSKFPGRRLGGGTRNVPEQLQDK